MLLAQRFRARGPLVDEIELYTPPEDNALHALAHAEFQERRGSVEYVSYLAGDQFRLLRIELSRP